MAAQLRIDNLVLKTPKGVFLFGILNFLFSKY